MPDVAGSEQRIIQLMTDDHSLLIRATLQPALAEVPGPLVLAISGGCDSMALLHAVARWAPDRVAAVATFDHASGQYATDAASLVAAEARRLGFTVVRERARVTGASEAAWRTVRWQFLHRVARAHRARVVTGHTRDDQVETIVMRLLRGAGARGLAALAAPSSIVRPWLTLSRREINDWVTHEQLPYLDDPSNASLHYTRGRVRHDLLPMLEGVHVGFDKEMLTVGARAAAWRRDVDQFVDTLGVWSPYAGALRVPVVGIASTNAAGRAVLWAALFARVRVALDACGTTALVRFTNGSRRGAHVTLAGGAVAMRNGAGEREWFELRGPARERSLTDRSWQGAWRAVPRQLGAWRWRRVAAMSALDRTSDPWCCALPDHENVQIRPWNAGDRIRTPGAEAGRRVTRYFSEAHIPALDRPTWPVVLVANEVVWIPGICRSVAAPHWPGRPDLIWYRCEREYD